jgi:hypothetical protein
MRSFILSIAFFLLALLPMASEAQINNKELIDSLLKYERNLLFSEKYPTQLHASKRISALLKNNLKKNNSIDISFDTLSIISVVTSKKKELRIFTWVSRESNGRYHYHGLVQSYNKRNKSYKIHELEDQSYRIHAPMKKTLSASKWYGARYYKLITKKYKGKTSFTLLGWKGIDMTKKAMVIEPIRLKSNGDISFGYPSFNLKGSEYFERNTRPRRVLFQFSAEANMTLVYDKQTILKKVRDSKVKNSRRQFGFQAQRREVRTKPKYKKIQDEFIIFDQLMPLNKNMEGMYAFYIPKINVLDALHFEKGKWTYYADIDARNKTDENPKKDNVDYDLFPDGDLEEEDD